MPTSTKLDEALEKREAFKHDALQAWEDFQRSGRHLTRQEANDWLAKLEAGEDPEPPVFRALAASSRTWTKLSEHG